MGTDYTLKVRTKDLSGEVFGRLTVVSFAGYKNFRATWNCQCECGTTKEISASQLIYGNTKSCGCLLRENKSLLTHGMTRSKEHNTWLNIKNRCYNPNFPGYHMYGERGIVMDEEFRDNFESFLAEVGPRPKSGVRWSIDRIDNTKGYIKGNITWATPEQQARNHGLRKDNNTGTNGVYYRILNTGHAYYVATWREPQDDGKNKPASKHFSVTKLGEYLALSLAVEYRNAQIERLKQMGINYSENHGEKWESYEQEA